MCECGIIIFQHEWRQNIPEIQPQKQSGAQKRDLSYSVNEKKRRAADKYAARQPGANVLQRLLN